ncbi:MAG: hypothetical protein FJ118_06515 [Deltaproteobacteria bacterium]|nr:hypothetical protein [Deltaproteobacteria bacterium]
MADKDDERSFGELDKGFEMLELSPPVRLAYEEFKARDKLWKQRDPEGFKADLRKMCQEMFGDTWMVEYEAMLREEFPDEAQDEK